MLAKDIMYEFKQIMIMDKATDYKLFSAIRAMRIANIH